ncbi:hypothetical protein [Amycolatopsis sp. H20-H5]|uniref:hypothetical protein n=1 Tax=Amycolatopsis sp. H20-H5 TaxID=3046309 RepID=UPI002DB8E80E|nr:hypothetical protein [Amycolatopsis sp. H20-H5]MEC3976379.1 hypothetical protein [Amycolatopsis sp. H20-H5]
MTVAGPVRTVPDTLDVAKPLRAVDRLEVLAGSPRPRFRAYKTVDPLDPYMPGHFPRLTLLPAVFVLEALRQATTTVVGAAEPLNLLHVVSGRWLSPMLRGDEICLDVTAEPDGPGRWTVRAEGSRQDGTPVAVVKLVLGESALGDRLEPEHGPPPLAAGPPPLDYAGMLDMLPVRHPMVLVDRVEAIEPGARIVVAKGITGGEQCYQGLPDGLPGSRYRYPRALMLESFGQASALLWLSLGAGAGVPVVAAFRDCRFAGEVYPGAVLRHEARIDRLLSDTVFISGRTWDGDHCVLSVGALVSASRPESTLDARLTGNP